MSLIPTVNSPLRVLFRYSRGYSTGFSVIELLLLMNNYLNDLSSAFNNFLNPQTIQKKEISFFLENSISLLS